MLKRAIVTVVAVLCAVLPASAGVSWASSSTGNAAGAGSAEPLAWSCPAGFSCYYDGLRGEGRRWVAPSCGFFNLGNPETVNPPFNDKISSVWNRGERRGDALQLGAPGLGTHL